MIKVNTMTIGEFFASCKLNDNGFAREIVRRCKREHSNEAVKLTESSMPLYKSGNSVLCGGENEIWVVYRAGYGYTCIEVRSRGEWRCALPYERKENTDIVFYDGEFNEVYLALSKHLFSKSRFISI